MTMGKTVEERIAWLKANLRPLSVEERVELERERLNPKCEVVRLPVSSEPVRRQLAIDSVWLSTKGKSRYDRTR